MKTETGSLPQRKYRVTQPDGKTGEGEKVRPSRKEMEVNIGDTYKGQGDQNMNGIVE